ncbi:MAG TPA: TMEM175 family protein [Chitinophagaceae bacterium]
MTKTRLEAFSDGVMAIVITIMVLELKPVPGPSWNELADLRHIFLSYIVSFVMIGIYWGNHHHLIHTIRDVKGGMIWANLHLLFWLSLIPFTTAWMGENHFEKKTVALYAFVANMCGVAYYILLTIIRSYNPDNEKVLELLRKQSRKGMMSCLFYTLAMGAAFIHTAIAGTLIILVAIMWLIPDRNIERSLKE